MATLTQTINLSSIVAVTLKFTITDGPDRVTVTLNTVTFQNKAGGTNYRWTLSGWSDISFTGANPVEFGNYNIPVGTTSRSWSPNKTKVLMKESLTQSQVNIDSYVHIEKYGAGYDFYEGSKDSSVTVSGYASYIVTYNANGGSGGPFGERKIYNETLILSTSKPTRTDYAFKNWNTSSAGSGTSYASGGKYTANAAATLYAQWQRTYSDPKASVVSVQRVDATTHDPDEYGTSVAVVVSWSLFSTPSGTNHPTSVVVACNGATETLTDLTGLTGTATAYLDAGCDPDQQYPVTVTLTDEGGTSRSVTAEGVVTTPYYPIDIRQGGRGVAIGGPSSEDAFDVFMPVKVLPRSTSASETPFAINDGTDDVLAVDWDGTMETHKDINLVSDTEDSLATTRSAASYESGMYAFDMNGRRVFYSETMYGADGRVQRSFAVQRDSVTNGLWFWVNADGTRGMSLSDASMWRNALGIGHYAAPTALPLASGCVAYSSGQTPRYARDGRVVSVYGAVKPTAEVAAGGTLDIGTLPAGFRPPQDVYVLCQGSGQNKWLLTVSTSGNMSASRYSSGATQAAITTGTWLPFCATFIATS